MTTAVEAFMFGFFLFGCLENPLGNGPVDAGSVTAAPVAKVSVALTPDKWTKATFEAYLAYQRKMQHIEKAFSAALQQSEKTDAGDGALEALQRREAARDRVLMEVGLEKAQIKALEATLGPLLAQRSAQDAFNLSEAQKARLEALVAKLPEKRRQEVASALKAEHASPLVGAATSWGDAFVQLYLQYEGALREQEEALFRARLGP